MKWPAIAALLLMLLLPCSAAVAGDMWFSIPAEAAAQWKISSEGDRLTVRRRGAKRMGARIMVLYSRPSLAYETAMGKVLTVFQDKGIEAVFEVINYRDNPEQGKAAIRRALGAPAKLIFAMGSDSTEFLAGNFKGQAIPVVSICAKDPVILGLIKDYDSGSGTNFAFTSLNVPVETQLTYMLQLRPNLKNVGILVDSKNLSAVQTQAKPFAAALRRHSIAAAIIAVNNPADARRELREKIPPAIRAMRRSDPGLANSILLVTGSTSVFTEIDTINAAAGRVPVMSAVPEIVRKGESSAALSIGVSFESNAHLAAIYAADILEGRSRVGRLKVGIVSPPDIAINFHKARHIGMKIPFSLFELASQIFDGDGNPVRVNGVDLKRAKGR
jgi:putative tryptophan/tyrosine transport system substrate-binding protein